MARSHVQKIAIEHIDPLSLLGQGDQTLKRIEIEYPVQITLRDATLSVTGGEEEAVEKAASALRELVHVAERGKVVEDADVSIARPHRELRRARLRPRRARRSTASRATCPTARRSVCGAPRR
jgi:phosphate starvation-inducible protein PhoH